jgi:hypothetical protein
MANQIQAKPINQKSQPGEHHEVDLVLSNTKPTGANCPVYAAQKA